MGETIVGGAIAILAATIGAVLAFMFERRAAEERQKAEDDRRWIVERRMLYGTFASQCNRTRRAIESAIYDFERDGTLRDGWSAAIDAEIEGEVEATHEQLVLVASPDIVRCCDKALFTLGTCVGGIRGMSASADRSEDVRERLGQALVDLLSECDDALEAMRNAMRVELGVPPLQRSYEDE